MSDQEWSGWRAALERHRAAPYVMAIAGVSVLTAAMAALTAHAQVANLSMVYLLLVLWLASRYGRWPAVTASIFAFLAYDYFLVPPVGTLLVSGPRELLELVVLLAAALVTGQLASSLRRTQALAKDLASESQTLYELATSMLKLPEIEAALTLLCDQAVALRIVRMFALVAIDEDGARQVAGGRLTDTDLQQAARAFADRQPVGVIVRDDALTVLEARTPAATTPLMLPLTNAVIAFLLDRDLDPRADLRMLVALIGLADLLLVRRHAAREAERTRSLEAADRLKAAILSSISHELKSPLASLRAGLTALMAPKSGLNEEQRELLIGLDRQAVRLDRFVGDLLTMSRIEAGVELNLEPSSYPEIVGSVLHGLTRELAGFRLRLEVPSDLPSVLVDELQMERLLANLVINAVEWTPAGGIIWIGAAVQGSALMSWVQNQGPTIQPQDLDQVFDKFWTRRTTGSGLGLAICKRVAEAHDGSIRVENRAGGPRFTFTIPLASVAVAQ